MHKSSWRWAKVNSSDTLFGNILSHKSCRTCALLVWSVNIWNTWNLWNWGLFRYSSTSRGQWGFLFLYFVIAKCLVKSTMPFQWGSGDYLNINSVNFKKINYLLLSLAVKEEVGGGSLLQLGNGQPLVGLPPADLSWQFAGMVGCCLWPDPGRISR